MAPVQEESWLRLKLPLTVSEEDELTERERKGVGLVPMRRVSVRTVGQDKGGGRGGTSANSSCSGSSDREHEPEQKEDTLHPKVLHYQ